MTLLELRDKLDYSFILLRRNADVLEYEALFPAQARMTEELKEELRKHKPELLQALEFEEEADRLLLESTRRLAADWPEGCALSGPPWEVTEEELRLAYRSTDRGRLEKAIEAREQYAAEAFREYRRVTP